MRRVALADRPVQGYRLPRRDTLTAAAAAAVTATATAAARRARHRPNRANADHAEVVAIPSPVTPTLLTSLTPPVSTHTSSTSPKCSLFLSPLLFSSLPLLFFCSSLADYLVIPLFDLTVSSS